MKKRIVLAILINLSIGASTVWAQNTGVGEPIPGSKLSVKGNTIIGTHYSTLQAPANGMLVEGQVGIGTTTPHPSAVLDLSSSTQGLLIPRLTSAQRTDIVSPASGLLVFDTDLNLLAYAADTGWIFIGRTVSSPISGLANISGTTNYVTKFSSASAIGNSSIVENGTGVGIGTATPAYPLQINSAASMSEYAYNSHKDHDAIWAHNGSPAGTGAGCGIVGITSQNSSMAAGVWGENGNSTGTGVVGFGNASGAVLMNTGSGGAFTGTTTGLFAKSNSSSASQAIYSDNFGSIVRVNYWSGTTQYKIQGTGTVSTIVKDVNNQPVVMHATETPEIYLQDYGQGILVNGKAHINLDPVFAKNITINAAHPLRVFVQLEGDCNGIYISGKSSSGFDVVELANGFSNTSFQYTVICNRADETLDNGLISKNADKRFEPAASIEKVSAAKRQLKKE
ncbi:MAG: hypothetical protein NTY88_12885 [Bacteroidetes bacterium]|nr:hypothetical protein [Bacteroidota bacterium]